MTPKEKADELYTMYCYALRTEEREDGFFTNVIQAKQCAIIAVDEILSLCWNGNTVGMKYWNKVKQEIEAL